MRRFSTAAKVGAFTIAMLVAAFLIYRFINKGLGRSEGRQYYALFNDASGIVKNSQVKVAGIPVGKVEDVKLDESGKARVEVRIDRDVPLFTDAAAAKVASSLLGEYLVTVTPGTKGRDLLPEGQRIPNVIEGTSTDDIMRQVAGIAADVKKVSEALANSIGTPQGQENLKGTLENLAQVTDALNQTVRENRETIKSILNNVQAITQKGQPEIEKILENVRNVTQDVRTMMAQAQEGKPGSQGEIRQVIDRVNNASKSLETAMQNIETVSGRLERGEGTLGRLTKDEKLINEVEGVADTVGDFVGGLNRLQTIIVLRTDYLFLTSAVKSYVELRLQPREDKYYSIEIVNDPRGLTRFEQIDVDTTNSNEPSHYREVRTVTTNSFRFSLQFAQRFGPFTGRFGIKESTGGVGLDLALFEDRFELRQDLFGFGEVVLPRWRVSLGYEFVKRLWLLGGVDDIFSDTRRDYFIGLQLKFNDEDLKTILPFAPAPK